MGVELIGAKSLLHKVGKLSDEVVQHEGAIANLAAEIKSAQHDQDYDEGRDIAINDEIDQLSDNIQQVQSDVQNIADVQHSKVTSLEGSADRQEQVVSAKLDKLESLLNTNSEQIHQLQQQMDGVKAPHREEEDGQAEDIQLGKQLQGQEVAINKNIANVEKVVSDVEKSLSTLNKHVNSLEANQLASQQKFLETLSELANGFVEERKAKAKTLETLYNVQSQLSQKVDETKKRENKPLMLVIPEQVTSNPDDIIKLHDAKHVINMIDKETRKLETEEEGFRQKVANEDGVWRQLQNETEETVKSLLRDADTQRSKASNEEKHVTKANNEEKRVAQPALSSEKFVIQELSPHGKGWSSWSDWSNCFGFGCKSLGRTQRYRVCELPRGQCGGDSWQHKSCRRTCGPRQSMTTGSWSDWHSWTECSEKCGSGTASRERLCNEERCTGYSHESKPCSLVPCAVLPAAVSFHSVDHSLPAVHSQSDMDQDSDVYITCVHKPCLNDGVCMSAWEGEHVSHFAHFHCECKLPYTGIMCDTSCRNGCEGYGIAIGVLAGVLAVVLLAICVSLFYSWRRRVDKWRRGSHPRSRRGRCWDTLFGSDSSTGSSYPAYLSTAAKCSTDSSICGGLSVDAFMHQPVAMSLPRDNITVSKSSEMLQKSASDAGETSVKDKTSTQSANPFRETTSEDSSSEGSDYTSETGSESETSSNDNDNAKEHTSTQMSLAKNVTNNQSALPTSASICQPNILKKKSRKSSPDTGGFPQELGQVSKRSKRGSCRKDKTVVTTNSQNMDEKAGQPNKPEHPYAPLPKVVTSRNDGNVTACSADVVEKKVLETQIRMAPVPTTRFRDPQLAERMIKIRNRIASSQSKEEKHILTKYTMVQDYMDNRSPLTPLPHNTAAGDGKLLAKPTVRKYTASAVDNNVLLPTDAANWSAVVANPVHSVWKQCESSPLHMPAGAEVTTLSASLASVVGSVRSFVHNVERSPSRSLAATNEDIV